MIDNSGCVLCRGTQETVLHVLRDCNIAREDWMKLLSSDTVNIYFVAGLEDWLHASLDGQFRLGTTRTKDSILFIVLC